MVMLERNGVPILAVILEPSIAIFMFVNAFLIYKKYTERKSKATLMLSLSIFSYGLAAFSAGIGKILQYSLDYTQDEISITSFTIIIAYCFTALGNIFVIDFVTRIFREGDSRLTLFFTTFNGMTLGFLLPNISTSPDSYASIIPYLLWHVPISIITFSLLSFYGFKESNITEQKIPRVGFRLIGAFGIAVASLFIFFILDIVIQTFTSAGSYTPFYYIGWTCGAIASILAYLGYVMPTWFKNKLS